MKPSGASIARAFDDERAIPSARRHLESLIASARAATTAIGGWEIDSVGEWLRDLVAEELRDRIAAGDAA